MVDVGHARGKWDQSQNLIQRWTTKRCRGTLGSMKEPSELPQPNLPETVPQEYAGKWVAWTKDAMRIVAAANTPEELKVEAERKGVRDIVYQWVPPADQRFVGAGP